MSHYRKYDRLTMRPPPGPRPPVPWRTRQAVYEQAGHACERCGGAERPLQLHHRHYGSLGREEPGDLELLCDKCHRDVHYDLLGHFWWDENEKISFWYTPED